MPISIVVTGQQNLYRTAAEQYSDALEFIALLQSNNFGSPFIQTPTVVEIPDDPQNVGGVPLQATGSGIGIISTPVIYPYTSTVNDDGVTVEQFQQGQILNYPVGATRIG